MFDLADRWVISLVLYHHPIEGLDALSWPIGVVVPSDRVQLSCHSQFLIHLHFFSTRKRCNIILVLELYGMQNGTMISVLYSALLGHILRL